MPSLKDYPEGLRPYVFHGMDFEETGGEGKADCPWCGGESKFYCNTESGLWDCKKCSESGNLSTFLQKLWEESQGNPCDVDSLMVDRGLENIETLQRWGVCSSILTDEWIIPGRNVEGKINTLYRYVEDSEGKRRLYVTPGTNHGLLGLDEDGLPEDTEIVYVCEGPWDGMVLEESLRRYQEQMGGEKKHEGNGKVADSIQSLGNSTVISAPSCSSFPDAWAELFGGRRVVLLYDSDHPRLNCKQCRKSYSIIEFPEETCPGCGNPLLPPLAPPAGFAGMRKASGVLSNAKEPPKEILYLHWGEEGYDSSLHSGYDVRDALTLEDRFKSLALEQLLSKVRPIPEEWKTEEVHGGGSVSIIPCSDYKTLTNAWRKAMKFHDGLDKLLSFSLAVVTSTPVVGDQLWGKGIGPPSSGKTQIAEALCTCRKYVYPASTLSGFHSGWRSKNEEGDAEENGLIPKIRNKTMVTKDGDTILTMSNRDQVLGQARDLYDGSAAGSYRNKKSYDWVGIRVTWLIYGTEALRKMDDESDLGGRFLDCVLFDHMNAEMERTIGMRVARRQANQMGMMVEDRPETDGPEMSVAKRLTGGYVLYLREHGKELCSKVEFTDEALSRIERMGEFVSFMRARPSSRQIERAQRELSFRLTSQLTRLAGSLAVVLNKTTLDHEVMRRVRQVAMDTARGRALEVAKHLHVSDGGMEGNDLSLHLGEPEGKTRDLLNFMRKIGAVGLYRSDKTTWARRGSNPGKRYNRPAWRLTKRLEELYQEVIGD